MSVVKQEGLSPDTSASRPDAGEVRGEWAVVLGPTSGAGEAIARALAHEPGLNIFGVHRGNHPDVEADVRAEVERTGHRAAFVHGQAGTAEGAEEGVRQLLEVAGPRNVHCFIHSISDGSIGYLVREEKRLHPKQIQKTFDRMAHSFVYWIRELVDRDALAPGARLIGLTNPVPESLLAHTPAITAAKAALEIYTRHLALELGPAGYRVNLVKFAALETTALRYVFPGNAWERVQQVHNRIIPAGRMCQGEELGNFISVLVGKACGWFNGATIDFSGGQVQSLYQRIMFPDDEMA